MKTLDRHDNECEVEPNHLYIMECCQVVFEKNEEENRYIETLCIDYLYHFGIPIEDEESGISEIDFCNEVSDGDIVLAKIHDKWEEVTIRFNKNYELSIDEYPGFSKKDILNLEVELRI